MKKTFLLLVISVVLFSCSKDADEIQDFTVILNVDRFYNFGNENVSTRAFLSDENGTILASGDLKKGQHTTLSYSKDPSAHFDLSYMRYYVSPVTGVEEYSLVTYTNIKAGTYYLRKIPFSFDQSDEISLRMNNTGFPLEVISRVGWAGDGGAANGGYLNFRTNLIGSPTSDFYASFKSPNDPFARYYWGESIPEGSVFNIDYNTLPQTTSIVNMQIPSNNFYTLSVEGLKNNVYHPVSYRNSEVPNTSLFTSIPPNFFENYLLNLNYNTNNKAYFKQMLTTTIPEEINTPSFNFTVNNHSPQNFNMSTTGEATIYNVTFKAEKTDQTGYLIQKIYGEVTSEVSFSKENLRMNIQQTYQGITGFETLSLESVSLTYYSLTNSYKDILKYELDEKPYEIPAVNGFIDGFSQRFD